MAYKEFKKGKSKKNDVQWFEFNLEDNLFNLHHSLKNKTYQHSDYTAFYVTDPKLRHIHKACIGDRVLHHAIFRILCPVFDKSFIFDSYSCRISKGTHKAVSRLKTFCCKLSQNNSRGIFALKCDIKKFFDSVDQNILTQLIQLKIKDDNAMWLIEVIIKSFPKGLPLGNVTSQLFANIYLDELDQFVKHILKEKYYLRYCDDLIILGKDRGLLLEVSIEINNFLKENFGLSLHPDKIIIRKYIQGIDFLGYVVLPHHRVLRTRTKKRMFRKLKEKLNQLEQGTINNNSFQQSVQSYLGVLSHANTHKLSHELKNLPFLRGKN